MATSVGITTSSSELAPGLPAQAPSHLFHLLQAYDEALKADAPSTSLRIMREAFAFLLSHFTDLIGWVCVSMGADRELYMTATASTERMYSGAEDRLSEGFRFLQTKVDESPIARALCEVFFDLESGLPRTFYLLTQGGRVEGALGGLPRLSDFCKEPKRAPSRGDSFKTQSAFRPHLQAWLEAGGKFWSRCKLEWERTDLKGNQRTLYKFEDQELEAGLRAQLNGCKACIPSRVIVIPQEFAGYEWHLGIPQEVPDHTLHLADRFSAALDGKEVISSCNLMRDLLEFLLRYFAGVAKGLCQELDCYPEEARRYGRDTESVDNCERLLQLCVDELKQHQDDPSAKALVSVFYRRNKNLELEPRAHTGVLLLEGVLSSWFKQERGQTPSPDRSRRDFERYFPLLRDWVGSMGPYFSNTEHFDEPPSEHGILPLTVRLGDRLLELVEPAYLLRIRQCPVCLPNPIWVREAKANNAPPKATPQPAATNQPAAKEAPASLAEKVAEPPPPEENKTYPGEYRPLEIPKDAPKFYIRMLRRLDVRLRRGEIPESTEALRDALDYLLRYWAGVAMSCAKLTGVLSEEATKSARSSLSVQECEKLLTSTLSSLKSVQHPLAEEIIEVFYKVDVFTDEFKPTGSHSRMLTMDASTDNKMQLLADFCEKEDVGDVRRGRADLKTYLPVLRDWLKFSQPFFEQCEHHEEEPDKEGRMELVVQFDQDYLELVAPDYAFYVRLGSDKVPDLPVPEWVEPEEPVEVEEVVVKPKVLSAEEVAMQEPFLVHKVAYVADQPNSKGKVCKSGIIKIINAGGGSLTGRAYSTHPCIEVSPARFRDNTQLKYWLDETDIPKDFVPTIVLRSGGDERQITIAELRPLGAFNTMSKGKARTLLVAPTVAMFLAWCAILLWKVGRVSELLKGAAYPLKTTAPDLLDQAIGQGHLVAFTFLLFAVAAPMITYHLHKSYPPSLQELTDKLFFQTTASPLVLAFLSFLVFRFDVTTNKEISSLYLAKLLPWFALFNLGAMGYINLNQTNKLAEWIPDPNLRKLVPAVLVAFFFMLSTLALM